MSAIWHQVAKLNQAIRIARRSLQRRRTIEVDSITT